MTSSPDRSNSVTEPVVSSINSFGHFSQQQISLVLDRLKTRILLKDEYLIREGQVCQAFYFVNQGSFRHYTIQENGVEATLNLFTTYDWLFEYKSFMTQQPSQHIIQAVTNSEVFSLGVWDFHDLIKIHEGFFRMGRILEQAIQNQDFQHNRLTPEQKYDRLLSQKPELLQNFPLKWIASYLGMTPETLSRIRRKISS